MTKSKGIVYYTDNIGDISILDIVRKNLKSVSNLPILSVSLKDPVDFGKNVVLNSERSYLTMCKQQLIGLENIDVDIVFLAEHDVLYPKCHFDFIPARSDIYYYNTNWWRIRKSDGKAFTFLAVAQFGLCAYRNLLINHYRKRIERVEKDGFLDTNIGYEPGLQKTSNGGVDDYRLQTWRSIHPLIDIRHDVNFSNGDLGSASLDSSFSDGVYADSVPFWGRTFNRFESFLENINFICDFNVQIIP